MKNNLQTVEGSDTSPGVGATLKRIKGNPNFKDQFNFQFLTLYHDAAGALLAPAALPANLQNQLPVFLFGNSDYTGGFDKVRGYFPLNNWIPGTFAAGGSLYGIINKESPAIIQTAGVFIPFTRTGDLFFNYYFPGGAGVGAGAIIIVRCPQVAYGSLLDSINSDIFLINMIRYIVPLANQNQLQNNIVIINKSVFGKTTDDKIDPNSFVTGETFNTNFSDIPVTIEVNKYKGMGFYINFDAVSFSWTVTVEKTRKITL